ncbi:MAG TPA: ADP-ribosylglycohydrolase family protein, partial [Candidatus Sumerlaeota bacterium]|nr:ADP-ribosylglycohydrolase family protein [Candidatus Sumerlaeota bacterium]
MKLLLILSRVFPIKTDSILDRKDPEGLSGTAFRKRRLRRLEPEKEFSQRILPHWSMFAAGWLPGAIIAWLAVRGDMLSDPLTTALIAYCFTFPIIFTWFCNIRRVRSYRELEWAWTFLLLNIISMLVWGSPAWKIILILSGAHALWAGARAAKDPEVALLSAGIYLKQKCWSRALLESHRCKNLPEGRLALAACYAGFGRNYDARTILQRILTTSRRQEQARQTFPWISRFLMTPLYLTPTDTEGTLMRKRFRGVMLGLACGDALGAPAEFMTREEIRERFDVLKDMSGGGSIGWAPGEYTDDTQMALCLADSLIARGGLDSTDLALRFVEWAESFPPDIGNQTKAALSHVRPLIKQGKDPLEAGRIVWEKAGRRNAGNGGIMRCAPAALAFSNEPEKADRAAELSCFLTH